MLDLLGAPLTGRNVVIAGYGYVGRGVAREAAALGARVTIAEVDPVKALEATFAGFRVDTLLNAARTADLLISATGIAHTIDVEHLLALPEGAAVAVSGGVGQEIAIDALLAAGATRHPAGGLVERFALPNGRGILILDDGGCINCTAGEGNPIEIMDLSFGVQLAAITLLATEGHTLSNAVHLLPASVDQRVARAKLVSIGAALDTPSAAQERFLGSWRETGRMPAKATSEATE
jgi:adenosylhomocysteinase